MYDKKTVESIQLILKRKLFMAFYNYYIVIVVPESLDGNPKLHLLSKLNNEQKCLK